MREKDFGIWQEYTWAQTWDLIETAAHGLLELGIDVGDRVTIHSEDRPEWVILDLATVAVRGITVGLYPTNPTAEVEYLISDCTPVVFFAEDQEQADKVLEVPASTAASVRRIIYTEPRGTTTTPGCCSGTPSWRWAAVTAKPTRMRWPIGWRPPRTPM